MEFNQENRSFCTPSAVLDTVAEQLDSEIAMLGAQLSAARFLT